MTQHFVSPLPNPPRIISDDALDEFIAIYKREFKEEIKLEDARYMANNLLRLYAVLARPLPKNDAAVTQPDDGDAGALRA